MTMKIEKQVCSLLQSKKLKELGIDERASFSWVSRDSYPPTLIPMNYYDDNAPEYNPTDYMGTIHFEYPAYGVAELGVMLSGWVDDRFSQGPDSLIEKYGESLSLIFNPSFLSDLLIYLLENNLITAHDCSTRLNS